MSGGRKGWRLKATITIPGRKTTERWHRLDAASGYTAHSREAAREAFTARLAAEFDAVVPQTFTDLAVQFFAGAAARALAQGSLATLRWHITRDVLPHLGTLEPIRITHHDCQRVIDAAATAGTKPNSLRRIRFAMSKLFSYAVAEGICLANPCQKMPPQPKSDSTTARTLTDAQYRAVLTAASGTSWRLVIEVLHATWIRRGELCGLQWADIDFANRTLMVRRAVWQTGKTYGIKAPKTRAGTRPIVLPQAIAEALAAHQATQAAWLAEVAERAVRAEDFVFQRPIGGHLMPTTVSHAVADFMRRAGVPAGLGPHALRHTGASLAMSFNADPRAVADRLGHSSVATTLDLYVHPSRPAQVGLADIMAQKAAELAAD
jgi:integrase